MAEFPALPLFTDAYLSDCGHLSDEEHGRYLLLLMTMWRSPGCRLPNDDAWLARKFRRSVEDVRQQLRPLIDEFCHSTGNWIMQKRLSREMEYVARVSKKRSDAANSRWEKKKSGCTSNAPTPTPTYTEEDKSSSAAPAAPVIEDLFYDGEPAPDPSLSLEKQCYDLGRKLNGKGYGGQVTKIKKRHGGDLAAVLRVLELGATKADPPTWLAAVANGNAAASAEITLDETDRLYAEWGVS